VPLIYVFTNLKIKMLIIIVNKSLESSGFVVANLGIFEVFKSNAGWGVRVVGGVTIPNWLFYCN